MDLHNTHIPLVGAYTCKEKDDVSGKVKRYTLYRISHHREIMFTLVIFSFKIINYDGV